jgi:hypothetical protein
MKQCLTVKQLIEQLEKLPPSATLATYFGDTECGLMKVFRKSINDKADYHLIFESEEQA